MQNLSSCISSPSSTPNNLSERRGALAVVPKHQLVIYRGAGLTQRQLRCWRCGRFADRVDGAVSKWRRWCQGAQVLKISGPDRTRRVVGAVKKAGGWSPATPTGDDAPGDADRGARVGVRCGHHVCVGGDGGWMRPFLRVETESRGTGSGGGGVYACSRRWIGQHHAVELTDVSRESTDHTADLIHDAGLGRGAVLQALCQVWGYNHHWRTLFVALFHFPPLHRRPLAHGWQWRRGPGAVGYRVALVFLRPVVCQLPPGVWRPITALWEGLNNGSLVGLFFFLNVDWDPLPQAWPVISFILCPGHCFTVGTVERKKQCAFYWLIKHK